MTNENLGENDNNEEKILLYLQGNLNEEEIFELMDWIETSPENQKYFDEVKAVWLATGPFASRRFDENRAWSRLEGKTSAPKRIFLHTRTFAVLKYAAIIVFFFALGSFVSWKFSSSPQSADFSAELTQITAPKGSLTSVVLPDRTHVWLNAGSTLTYSKNFNLADRTVILSGEGYFDVTSNKRKPFIVRTSHLSVKALGTIFNVKSYDEDQSIEATLIEGSVLVQSTDDSSDEFTYTLKPGENIIYFKPEAAERLQTGKPLRLQSHVRTDLYTSWKDKSWVLESEPLPGFIEMLQRRYNRQIVLDSALDKYKITCTIRNESLEQVLHNLQLTVPLKFETVDGTVRLTVDAQLREHYLKALQKQGPGVKQ